MSFVVFKVVGVFVLLCNGCYLTYVTRVYKGDITYDLHMTKNMKRVDLMMPKEMIKKLDKIAAIEFETRSNMVRRAVNKYLSEFDFVKVNNE